MQECSERLVGDQLRAPISQVAPPVTRTRRRSSGWIDIVQERTKGVVTDDQIRALLDGYINIRGMTYAPVHVVDAIQTRWLVEEGERRGRLNGLGDGQLAPLIPPEDHPFGGIQVTSAEIELHAELALEGRKIVGHRKTIEIATKPTLQRAVVEEACGNRIRSRRKRSGWRSVLDHPGSQSFEIRIRSITEKATERSTRRFRQPREAAHEFVPDAGQITEHVQGETSRTLDEFSKVRRIKIDGAELVELFAGAFENPHHGVRTHATRQGNREQSAGGKTDIGIEITQPAIDEIVLERGDPPHLERTSGHGPTGKHQSDLGILLRPSADALANQGETHWRSPLASAYFRAQGPGQALRPPRPHDRVTKWV